MVSDDDWGEALLHTPAKKSTPSTTKELPPLLWSSTISPKVMKLWEQDTAVQRSEEWYNMRKSCITASDIGSVIPRTEAALEAYADDYGLHLDELTQPNQFCNPYSDLDEVVLRKCNMVGGFTGNVATEWGSKYEPVAQTFYERLNKTDLLEFGLMIDPENKWLGASPDGITTTGIMLEIKCPLNRQITSTVPLTYWIQQQIQMQVCKLDRCDFLDCLFLEFVRRETWLKTAQEHINDPGPSRYGAIFLEMGTQKYVYPPKELYTVQEHIDWERAQYIKNPYTSASYYVLKDYIITPVKRSTRWFESNKGTILKAWDIILDVRTHGLDAQLKESQDLLARFQKSQSRPKRKRNAPQRDDSIPKSACLIKI